MREEFEKLSVIKHFKDSFDFDKDSDEYVRSTLYDQPEYLLGFFNGAWYAFQEKQKKIDELISRVSDRSIYDKVSGDKVISVDKIKELLK